MKLTNEARLEQIIARTPSHSDRAVLKPESHEILRSVQITEGAMALIVYKGPGHTHTGSRMIELDYDPLTHTWKVAEVLSNLKRREFDDLERRPAFYAPRGREAVRFHYDQPEGPGRVIYTGTADELNRVMR